MAALAAESLSTQHSGQREPSMEEILASIRRIIEDSDGKAESPVEAIATTSGVQHRAANTQTAKPTHERTAIDAVRAELAAPSAAAKQTPVDAVVVAPAPKIAEPPKQTVVQPAAEPAKTSIISDVAGRQVAAAFGELSDAFAATRRRSFDEVAEEMMRPMLQEWLDNNLPTLVEKLVREEIERIARG